MSNIQHAINELSAALEEIELPRDFLESYDQLECLSHNRGTETYLVQHKGSQALYIAKCYDRKIYKSVNESSILKVLHNEGLPAFMNEYQNDAAVCIVREYVEGTPLDKYIAEHSLSEAQIVALCVELCDILSYLHGQKPPVIHRDIKPQNIIVKWDGSISLIDFDIARTYDNEAETDTQFIGTRTYAPPEQYGFSQTDCRADIYSLGILLCFLLTGNTNTKTTEIANKQLAAIVRRCAAFSPEERFADIAAVRKALLYTDGRKQKRLVRLFAACAFVCFFLCVGFVIGRYTSFLTPHVFASGVQFTEPLIEQAIRAQLGKDEEESITEQDLLSVREIYIFGNEVSTTNEAFSDGLGGRLRDTPRGALTSLVDMKLLPNLEVLYVNYQILSDISPLADLKYLTDINLRHTFVEDISALSNMPHLNSLVLFDTHVADMSCLGFCSALNYLNAGETSITSLDALPDTSSLKTLDLNRVALPSIDGIQRFERLQTLDLSDTNLADLSPLLLVSHLQTLYLDGSMRTAAEALGDTVFEILYK